MIDKISTLAKKVFGDANERELKKLRPLVARINELEPRFKGMDDAALQAMTPQLKTQVENGASLDDILPEAFAVVREAARRTLHERHYDVQLVGAIVLHQGKIAEMRTGEGKTLVATMPIYLNALSGKGAHVVTVNDYLASRDADWMGVVYNYLGMSVGKILSDERDKALKRRAYLADITYGTNNEYGFDYLRDNMEYSLERYVQRGHNYAIVDEVDSILIDEARTPLIISGPAEASIELYYVVDKVIPLLQREVDFVVDEKSKACSLTEEGVFKVEEKLGVDNLFDVRNIEVLHHVNQSLKAHHIFKRDRDYVIRDGKVTIVDEFTGRLMHGRRWSDGLHQAVEAKEKVEIEQESQVYATITFQNYFRLYDKLAGMTGTAETEASEFASIYDLDTLVIPTNRPIARLDYEDIVYKTQMEKFAAVIAEIKACQERGQPVLVGTTSVEKSEILAKLLTRAELRHEVLNAKNHAREADIVAQAGRKGSITLSTNMAGRGTDIRLGGNPEGMAAFEANPEQEPERYLQLLDEYTAICAEEQKHVLEAGGLHIVGTERHEARRVDNQLRGRAGRQGDPGSSRFYLSLEDDLLRIFGSDKITVWMERMGLKDDEPIEHRWITRAIENAQKKVEGHNFQIRKNLLEYDDVMNYQRKGVYDLRKRALAGEDIEKMCFESLENVVFDIMDDTATEGVHPEHWRIDELKERLERIFGIVWTESAEELRDHSREEILDRLMEEAKGSLRVRIEDMGEEVFLEIGRMLILQLTDQLWKEHLLAIDRLRQGVSLRGYGQRNPLLEYKREAFQMFIMMAAMRDEILMERLFHAQLGMEDAASRPSKGMARRLAAGALEGKVPQAKVQPGKPSQKAPARPGAGAPLAIPNFQPFAGGEGPAVPKGPPKAGDEARAFAKENGVGRNDPCPCESGKKFKKCCGRPGAQASA